MNYDLENGLCIDNLTCIMEDSYFVMSLTWATSSKLHTRVQKHGHYPLTY